MKWTAGSLLTAAALLGTTLTAAAQQDTLRVRPGGTSNITVRGFVSATMFLQDAAFGFGNGQNAGWVSSNPDTDSWLLSGDVRNTRLGLDFRGPPIAGGWTVGGTVELDFFGGFAPGAFGDEQPVPRLRLAFADLARGRTTLRIGQTWSPLFGYVPVSLSHLAFPLGYGTAGKMGWRFPGVFLYQTLTGPEATARVQLQVAAMRGSWDSPGIVTDHLSAGETSAFPQFQARLDASGRTEGGTQWGSYVVGHYDRKDLSGFGAERDGDDLDGTAVSAGLRLVPGPVTLHGSAYVGKAIGQHLAHITQFGDFGGWGAWGQAGYAINPAWSAWFFYGIDNPDTEDLRRALIDPFTPTAAAPRREARHQNQIYNGMLRYGSGPYQIGVEWLHARTVGSARFLSGTPPVVGNEDFVRNGNQFSFSILYSF